MSDVPARPRDNVVFLGASEFYTPEQVLQDALNRQQHSETPFKDVLLVGVDTEGVFTMQSSHMSREWALWLTLELQDYVRRVGRHADDNDG